MTFETVRSTEQVVAKRFSIERTVLRAQKRRKSTAASKASAHLLVRVVEEELAQHDRRPPALLRAAAVLDARAQVQVVRGGVEQRRGLGAGRGLVLLERQLVVHAWAKAIG